MKILSFLWILVLSTTLSAQTTELLNCPAQTVLTTFGQTFACNPVAGATEYKFTFTNIVTPGVTVYNANWNVINLSNAGLNDLNAVYNVQIEALVGAAYTAPGSTCQIVAPTTIGSTEIINGTYCTGTPTLPTFGTQVYCSVVPGATSYEFEYTEGGNTTIHANGINKTSLFMAGLFDINKIYTVKARAIINGTNGVFGNSCTLQSPGNVASTSLIVTSCGAQVNYTTQIKASNVIGATEYQFKFYDQGTTTLLGTSIETYKQTTLANAGLANIPFAQYDVTVAVKMGTSPTFGAEGAICQIYAPTIVPNTKIATVDCGLQTVAFSDVFSANAVANAVSYEFEFTDITNAGLPFTVASATNTMDFATAGIAVNNTTYSIRVLAVVGAFTGQYSNTCTINTPITILPSELNAASCGATLTSFADNITAVNVPGATNYRFKFFNTTPGAANATTIFEKAFHTTSLAEAAGMNPDLLDPSIVYDVDISVEVNGSYLSYGAVCSITAPSAGTYVTTLSGASCGTTLTGFAQKIYASPVIGATTYEYQISQGPTVIATLSKGWNNFKLTEVGNPAVLGLGATYDIKVRVIVGGVQGGYTGACSVTTPSTIPSPTILTCGSLNSFGQTVFCTNVAGASEYKFTFTETGPNTPYVHSNTWRASSLTLAGAPLSYGTTYDVFVEAKIGADYSAPSVACQIITPAMGPIFEKPNTGEVEIGQTNSNDKSIVLSNEFELNMYPNPASTNVTIESNQSDYNVAIYASNGQLVYSLNNQSNTVTIPVSEFETGMYIVSITSAEGQILSTKKLSVIK